MPLINPLFVFFTAFCVQASLPIMHCQASFRGVSAPEFALNLHVLTPGQSIWSQGRNLASPGDLAVLTFAYDYDHCYWLPGL